MPVIISVGTQWGDEGKGKVADFDSGNVDGVIRYQGGNNTGRTTVNEFGKTALHLVPTGIFQRRVCIIERGVALHPSSLIAEIEDLEGSGIDVNGFLRISPFSHLVMPWHIVKDLGRESSKKEGTKIGTTGKGIGPCYQDKMGRAQALRVADLLDRERFLKSLEEIYRLKSAKLSHYGGFPPLDEVRDSYLSARERIVPLIADTSKIIQDMLQKGKALLLEGAQAILLDIDHGTYPYVTSSSTGSMASLMYTGIPPDYVQSIKGVAKAYMTRVGEGPFPTEIHGAEAERLRTLGKEYGTTTGRPRRCGWLDLPLLLYAVRALHATELALTKLDVLGNMKKVKVCVGYKGVKELGAFEFLSLGAMEPVYEEIEGWGDLGDPENRYGLPRGAQRLIEMIEEFVDTTVTFISTGPERNQFVR